VGELAVRAVHLTPGLEQPQDLLPLTVQDPVDRTATRCGVFEPVLATADPPPHPVRGAVLIEVEQPARTAP